MNAGKQTWVLVEHKEGQLSNISLEMLNLGNRLAEKCHGELCALAFGNAASGLPDKLASCGAIKAYLISDLPLRGYTGEAYAEALSQVVREKAPEILICSTTSFGQDIASRLAAQLKLGLAANCLSLDIHDNGSLLATRSVYEGKLAETVSYPVARPQIATVRPGAGDGKPLKTAKRAEIICLEPQFDPSKMCTRVTGFCKADPDSLSISEAEIIVAGGGGIFDLESFRLLEKLAGLLGGSIAASRVLVDRGWVPFKKQVGQTGMTVSPRLYLAVGISGSIYHTMGMKDSEIIIAINKDRNAPIFKLADLSVVGDSTEIISALVEKLEKRPA